MTGTTTLTYNSRNTKCNIQVLEVSVRSSCQHFHIYFPQTLLLAAPKSLPAKPPSLSTQLLKEPGRRQGRDTRFGTPAIEEAGSQLPAQAQRTQPHSIPRSPPWSSAVTKRRSHPGEHLKPRWHQQPLSPSCDLFRPSSAAHHTPQAGGAQRDPLVPPGSKPNGDQHHPQPHTDPTDEFPHRSPSPLHVSPDEGRIDSAASQPPLVTAAGPCSSPTRSALLTS